VMNKWIGLCFSDGEAQLFILCYIKFTWSYLWSRLCLGSHVLWKGWSKGTCGVEQGGVNNGALHNEVEQ
jgi:hypothetical protein